MTSLVKSRPMACLKCKSDWVTATGRNCASCPHCCKQQRCKARKEGRWRDEPPQRSCLHCGKHFKQTKGNRQSLCSEECYQARRTILVREARKAKQNGLRPQVQLHDKQPRACKRCGADTKDRRHAYCGRECYNAHKKSGVVSWDRTGQQLGFLRRQRAQGLPLPSQVMHAAIREAMTKHWASIASLWKAMNQYRQCKHCDGPLKDHATEATVFCSSDCASHYQWVAKCRECGESFAKKGVQGKKLLCLKCRKRVRNRWNRDTKNHRKRCRRYGGKYNKAVKSVAVFKRDNYVCHICNKRTIPESHWLDPRHPTIDHHPVPLSKGGDHDWYNVRCACRLCNSRKSDAWDGQRRLRLAVT